MKNNYVPNEIGGIFKRKNITFSLTRGLAF
ncbi:hypothetical protein HNQ76_000518 [Thermosulfuriphilus ammonigenes]|nr:hypothetical protein [Thermosulfuriphilus ammonigenes]